VAAIQAGHTALYRSASDLAQDMPETEATGTCNEASTTYSRGRLAGSGRAPLRERGNYHDYQPPLEDWGQVLRDDAAAGAIPDRFLHHAEVIRLQGRSYRMHNRRELQSNQVEEALM
jgi:hypothetical protein